MLSCEIISVGTELLLGEIIDTNAPFLSAELAEMGIAVQRRATVGDNPARLREAVQNAFSRSDIVLLTGGLGPTADDVTKEVCMELLGFPAVRNAEAEQNMRDFFARTGREMPESNVKQADVPLGGIVFQNAHGTAPGVAMEKNGKCVILLPGPPREAEPMFLKQVKPYLQSKTHGVIRTHTVRTMGIGESAMASRVADLLEGSNPTVAPYAKTGEALLRVAAAAETEDAAEHLMQPLLEEIRRRLGAYIYAIDADSIEQVVVQRLSEKGLHVATAESCTAGLIAKRLTDIPGASSVFDCGVVTYSNACKQTLLGVSDKTLQQFGAVSAETAQEMALGLQKLSGADISVAVTGVAGPGCSEQKPAGLIFLGIADRNGVHTIRFETGRNDRDYNRYVTASKALHLVWQSIQNY